MDRMEWEFEETSVFTFHTWFTSHLGVTFFLIFFNFSPTHQEEKVDKSRRLVLAFHLSDDSIQVSLVWAQRF